MPPHGRLRGDGRRVRVESVWERARGRLRVLVNVGERAPEEAEFPTDESHPVRDFPQVAELLHEWWAGGGRPQAWVEGDGPEQTAKAEGEAAHSYRRVAALRRRGRGSCVIAPIVLHGRAWGELYVARPAATPPSPGTTPTSQRCSQPS